MSSEKLLILFLIFFTVSLDIISSGTDDKTKDDKNGDDKNGDDKNGDDKKGDGGGGGGDDKKPKNVLEFLMGDLKQHFETHATDLAKIYENIASDFEMKRRKRELETPKKRLTTEEYVTLKLIDILDKYNERQRNKRDASRDEVDVEIERMLLLEKLNKGKKKNSGRRNPEDEPLGGSPRKDTSETDTIPGGGAPFVSNINPGGDSVPNDGFGGNPNTPTVIQNSGNDPFGENAYSRNPNSGRDDFGGAPGSENIGSDPTRDGFASDPSSRNDNFGGNPNSGRDTSFGGDPNSGRDSFGGDPNPGRGSFGGGPNSRRDSFGGGPNSGVDSFGGGPNSGVDSFGGGSISGLDSFGGGPNSGGDLYPKNPSFGPDPDPEHQINTNSGFSQNNNPAGKTICNSCSCDPIKKENLNSPPKQPDIPYGQEGRIEVKIVTEVPQTEYITRKNRGKRSFFYPLNTIFDRIFADEIIDSAP